MKLNPMTTSTQQQTSKPQDYGYPQYLDEYNDPSYGLPLQRPNPPTPEAVKRAQFVDKTYVWKEATSKAQPS